MKANTYNWRWGAKQVSKSKEQYHVIHNSHATQFTYLLIKAGDWRAHVNGAGASGQRRRRHAGCAEGAGEPAAKRWWHGTHGIQGRRGKLAI